MEFCNWGEKLHQLWLQHWCVCSVAQLCPTLCDPIGCSLLGSSVHGILQARILEWVATSSFRRSSWPRDWTCVSCFGRQILYYWATWEALWVAFYSQGTGWGAVDGNLLRGNIKGKEESEEKLKSLLMKVKEESKKVGLKFNIQKTKVMASGSITSWQIDGESVETVADFILGGSKITPDGDCSHEIKRRLLLVRKVMTNLFKAFLKAETLLCRQRSV